MTLSLSEAGPGRFGGQESFTDIYHVIPYQGAPAHHGCATAEATLATQTGSRRHSNLGPHIEESP